MKYNYKFSCAENMKQHDRAVERVTEAALERSSPGEVLDPSAIEDAEFCAYDLAYDAHHAMIALGSRGAHAASQARQLAELQSTATGAHVVYAHMLRVVHRIATGNDRINAIADGHVASLSMARKNKIKQ